jgi:H+/Cl- antiporter ClcA
VNFAAGMMIGSSLVTVVFAMTDGDSNGQQVWMLLCALAVLVAGLMLRVGAPDTRHHTISEAVSSGLQSPVRTYSETCAASSGGFVPL